MTDPSIRSKMILLTSRLECIKKRQKEHHRLAVKFESIHRLTKASVHALNAVSMTSLVLTMVGTNSSLIICAVTNGLSAIGTAVLEVLDLNERQVSHYNTHTQLSDLYNHILAATLHDSVTSSMLDTILEDLNQRSALVYDSAPLIRASFSSHASTAAVVQPGLATLTV